MSGQISMFKYYVLAEHKVSLDFVLNRLLKITATADSQWIKINDATCNVHIPDSETH